ncbi:DNA-directed RNA polymerase [Trypanosoma rangeli]|uniref:DNA-directed RNA polymerase n=1 Tax=Trypanosoma rangeli TaxID=5698 RepID=A0A3R7NQJ5_TRYRA|nr:DNA-directed RNA polymerase [Trypanosoma rangeli]RNF06150.1 DNA-directed RNA polymerase [Trypanosoma rangeli]|eukprot:RNF06150.1 DNA-directed RNA polymerase [Trypanosoma rangeli]
MSSASLVANTQQRILSSLSLSGQEAVPFATLQRDLALDQRTAADALRGLMEGGKVVLRRGNTDGSVYVALSNSMPEGPSLVLDAIRSSGNSGIDQTTLCGKVRLPKNEIIKSLQLLVAQKRIKERRCFSNRAKRIYLLFEFEPSDEITGGTFYGGEDSREMDVWFVDEMRRRIVALVAQRHSVSLEQITHYLHESHGGSVTGEAPLSSGDGVVVMTAHPSGLTVTSAKGSSGGNKRISQRDTQLLVQTLVLDGVLDSVTAPVGAPPQYQLATGKNVLRHFTATLAAVGGRSLGGATSSLEDRREPLGDISGGGLWVPASVAQSSAWAMPVVGLPCLGCPQLPVCSVSGIGVVNPRNCAYLNEWLS